MDELLSGVEKIIALVERMRKLQLLTHFILFLFSLLVIILDRIPFINGKLSDMNTLYTIAILIFCFSSSIILLAILVYCYDRFFKYSPRRVQRIINKALTYLQGLSPDELSLLKYIYNRPCDAVYIPGDNAAGLSLIQKGILQLVIKNVYTRGYKAHEPRSCYLYTIQPRVRDLVRANYDIINWKDAPVPDYDKYQ